MKSNIDMDFLLGGDNSDSPIYKLLEGEQEQWPKPIELQTVLSPVLPFDTSVLPTPIREWVECNAALTGFAAEFYAVGALVSAASIIGAKVRVQPKLFDKSWLIVPTLWGVVIGPSGFGKTPPLRLATAPLRKFEKEAFRKHEFNLAQYNAKTLRDKPNTNDKFELDLNPSEPMAERFVTDSATAEKLAVILGQNPRGILFFADELSGPFKIWSKDGRQGERQFFLSTFDGNLPFTSDTIGRGTNYSSRLCLSLLGGIQPDSIKSLILRSANAGENDGLTQRLQLMVFPDRGDRDDWIDRAPSEEIEQRYLECFELLSKFDFTTLKPDRVIEGEAVFCFSSSASMLYQDFWEKNRAKRNAMFNSGQKGNRADQLLAEHYAKYERLVPVLAVIHHLINCVGGSCRGGAISEESVFSAVRWTEYLRSHAIRVYRFGLDIVGHPGLKTVQEKLKRRELEDCFSARDLARKGWINVPHKVEAVNEIILELERAHWIKGEKEATQTSVGRPPSERYIINPRIYEMDCQN